MGDFLDALELWVGSEPYGSFPCATIGWRLLPALEHGRYRLYRGDGGEVRGFVSWGFMTRHEYETREYSGSEVFGRDDGECLVVVDMIAPYGRNDVVWICRDLRVLFKDLYPWHEHVLAHRGRRDGTFPNMGG